MEQTQKSNSPFIIAIIFLLSLLLVSFGIIIFLLTRDAGSKTINSFADCAAAGYPILESYPEQCNTPDGKHFTRPLTPEEEERVRPPQDGSSSGPQQTEPSQGSAQNTVDLKVYFSQNPLSMNDFTYTVAVERKTARTDVGTYAIEQIIQGPLENEANQKLFTPLKLTGTSNCEGKDFLLTIDQARKATLKFCKNVVSAGVGDDARISTLIEKTLLQFSTVSKVVILTNNNDCFGDQSGMQLCKD
jgi:hypothetical protein